MNETVISFCRCLKFSVISVKLNILYLCKGVGEIMNNGRANKIFISTGLFNTLEKSSERKYQIN